MKERKREEKKETNKDKNEEKERTNRKGLKEEQRNNKQNKRADPSSKTKKNEQKKITFLLLF